MLMLFEEEHHGYRIEKRKEEKEGGAPRSCSLTHSTEKETGLSKREKERNLRRAEADRDKTFVWL